MPSRQYVWQQLKLRQGLCANCGKRPLKHADGHKCAECIQRIKISRVRRAEEKRIQQQGTKS